MKLHQQHGSPTLCNANTMGQVILVEKSISRLKRHDFACLSWQLPILNVKTAIILKALNVQAKLC
jgi:hypothetical protein